jgi:hypothetical protein
MGWYLAQRRRRNPRCCRHLYARPPGFKADPRPEYSAVHPDNTFTSPALADSAGVAGFYSLKKIITGSEPLLLLQFFDKEDKFFFFFTGFQQFLAGFFGPGLHIFHGARVGGNHFQHLALLHTI